MNGRENKDPIQVPNKKEVISKKIKKSTAEGSAPLNSQEYFFSGNLGRRTGGDLEVKSVQKKNKISTKFKDYLKVIPDWFDDGSQDLDQLDKEIASRHEKHVKEMKRVEERIEAIKGEEVERKKRFKENEKLRNRLQTELTEKEIQRMLKENSEYLKRNFIW